MSWRLLCTISEGGPYAAMGRVCVCVCLCAKGSFPSCSNREVQHSYFPTMLQNHQSNVHVGPAEAPSTLIHSFLTMSERFESIHVALPGVQKVASAGIGVCVCVCVWRKNNIKEGDPHGSRAPRGRPGRHQNQCTVQYVLHPVRRPSGSQLEASPRSEPLVGWGYVTSVPARPCLVASCCITRARFARGGGGQGTPVLSWRPGLLALTPAGVAWASSLRGFPPPSVRSPAALALLPGAPRGRLRSCAGGRGCPTCPRARQCRTPRPTTAHVAHYLCLCVAQTRRRGSWGCCSGRMALAQRCGSEKSAALTGQIRIFLKYEYFAEKKTINI